MSQSDEPKSEWDLAAARFLTRTEPYEERTRGPIGLGVWALFLVLFASSCFTIAWAMGEMGIWP